MSAWNYKGDEFTRAKVARRRLNGERLPLSVLNHQGMGDHLICQGIYRTLAEDWNVRLLVMPHCYENVRIMLADVPAIKLLRINSDAEGDQYCRGITDQVVLRLGATADDGFDKPRFDQEFYRQAMVPFSYRWSRCLIPQVPQIKKPSGAYYFIHDRPDFNNARLTMPGIRPDPGSCIFAHRDLILGASQIHCVSSSFATFADSLPLDGSQLHFYPFGRETPQMRHAWQIH